jgi:hypothetical protein
MTRPIFVTGSQRSGTSWLASVLAAGGQVAFLDEPFSHKQRDPGQCAVDFPHWFTYIGPHNGAQFAPAVGETLRLRYNLPAALGAVRRARQLRRVWRNWRTFAGYRRRRLRPLVKQPTGLFMAEWLAERFGAQVLVVIRHPAGYVSSRLRLGWRHDFNDFLDQPALMATYLAPLEDEFRQCQAEAWPLLDQLALLWKALYGTVRQLQAAHPDWLFVRYEDVAADPAGQFPLLYAALNLDYNQVASQAVAGSSAASNPGEVSVAQWKTVQRHSQAAAKTWQTRLTPAEIDQIRARVAPVADLFYDEEAWLIDDANR